MDINSSSEPTLWSGVECFRGRMLMSGVESLKKAVHHAATVPVSTNIGLSDLLGSEIDCVDEVCTALVLCNARSIHDALPWECQGTEESC